jgi:hypothetical protein
MEVFQPGLSTGSEAISKMTSARIRMPFEEPLPLKSSKIAVKGAALGQGSKQNVNIVGS